MSTSNISTTTQETTTLIWFTPAELAAEYGKNPWTICRWCASGFMAQCGFVVHRDLTGHWLVGVPQSSRASLHNPHK